MCEDCGGYENCIACKSFHWFGEGAKVVRATRLVLLARIVVLSFCCNNYKDCCNDGVCTLFCINDVFGCLRLRRPP